MSIYFLEDVLRADLIREAEEIAALLVARTLSNKKIAAQCKINVHTDEAHVSHILNIKCFSNRVESSVLLSSANLLNNSSSLIPRITYAVLVVSLLSACA